MKRIHWLLVALAIILLLPAFAKPRHHASWESYDQENLKRHDIGCPTAVYVAPKGELVQCQTLVDRFQVKPESAPAEFDNPILAAIAGFKLIAAKPTALYYEWGGEIALMPNGKFAALAPNTSFSGDHVHIDRNDFGLNAVIVGHYHTHPCLPDHWAEYFSVPDMDEVVFGRLSAFMGDFCSGNVHAFFHGDKPDVEVTNHGVYLTKGRIVGQFTEPHALTVAE